VQNVDNWVILDSFDIAS